MEELELKSLKKKLGGFRLRFEGDTAWLFSSDGTSPMEFHRDEAQKVFDIVGLWGGQGALTIRRQGKKLQFKLDGSDKERLESWLGPPSYHRLRAVIRRRYAFTAPIAVLLMLASLPLPGDPETGLEPVPFNPVTLILGLGLLGLWLVGRIRPRPSLFLLDSAWFSVLAVTTLYDVVARGSSVFWLVFVVLMVVFAYSGVIHYRQFRNVVPGDSPP